MIRQLCVSLLLLLPFVTHANDVMLGTWEGVWTLEEARPIASDPLPDSLPESLPMRLELFPETIEFFWETSGEVFVDSAQLSIQNKSQRWQRVAGLDSCCKRFRV